MKKSDRLNESSNYGSINIRNESASLKSKPSKLIPNKSNLKISSSGGFLVDNRSLISSGKYGSDSLLNYYVSEQDNDEDKQFSQLMNSAENSDKNVKDPRDIILSQSIGKSSYIVEPVAFIQNLASSIMGISFGQFIYNRILDRLIIEANRNGTIVNQTSKLFSEANYLVDLTTPSPIKVSTSNGIPSPEPKIICLQNNSNLTTIINSLTDYLLNTVSTSSNALISTTTTTTITATTSWQNGQENFQNYLLSPDDLDKIRTKAQEQTAHLYFISALFCGIPVIIMTNLLGVNCSSLGRKTLMLIYLISLVLRYGLYLMLCLFPNWPDWTFYIGAFIDGLSGGGGVFYLALYCFISDLTDPSSRSYRITLLNNMNSIASLCVTFMCGYVIKYYGYFYLFASSVFLVIIALFYTIFLIPEPLIQLHNKSFRERLRSCSLKKSMNCFTVYFTKHKKKSLGDDEATSLLGTSSSISDSMDQHETPYLNKQTFVLLLIVLANFIYNFATNGIGSIFALFIMNAPYCFDSIQISQYSVFATVVSLVMSLFVSKFIKVNDLIICILSVGSYFASIFCYIYGNSIFYIYIGALISSIAGLQYSYCRSIVSKSVDKSEVDDALSLILIVDTFIAVVSGIVYPILYSKIVSQGIVTLFSFSNGFVLIALILNIINYLLYVPIKERQSQIEKSNGEMIRKGISLSEENIYHQIMKNGKSILVADNSSMNGMAGESIINPMHTSIMLSSIESI